MDKEIKHNSSAVEVFLPQNRSIQTKLSKFRVALSTNYCIGVYVCVKISESKKAKELLRSYLKGFKGQNFRYGTRCNVMERTQEIYD